MVSASRVRLVVAFELALHEVRTARADERTRRDFLSLDLVAGPLSHEWALARDFGVEPVGPAYTFEDADVEHIGKPLAEADN